MFVLLLFFQLLVVSLSLSSSARQRIAVFGGNSSVGQEVCRVLVELCGYGKEDLVSISRSGAPPTSEASWTKNVDWISADLLKTAENPTANLVETIGSIDVCIDCVGTKPTSVKMSTNKKEREKLTDDGPLTQTIASIAKEAGAARFVYMSLSSEFNEAYGGALEGFVDSKLAAEQELRSIYNDDTKISIIAPTTTCGQDNQGKPKTGMYGNPLLKVIGGGVLSLSKASSLGEDFALRCKLLRPVTLQTVARVCVAAGLGLTRDIPRPGTAAELAFTRDSRYAEMSRGYNDAKCVLDFVDGNQGCEILAESVATPDKLRAAAAAAAAQ